MRVSWGKISMHRWPKKLGLALTVILILPVAETATLFAVARRLGVGWTVLLLAAAMAAGIYVFLVAGPRRISGLRQALARGELPAPPLFDGVILLVAALLFLFPGFLTDCLALLLLIPAFRSLVRRQACRLAWRYVRGR